MLAWTLLTVAVVMTVAAVVLQVKPTGTLVLGGRRYWTFAQLVRSIEHITQLTAAFESPGDMGRLCFNGQLSNGRTARVDFYSERIDFERRGRPRYRYFVRLSVEADATPNLKITEENFGTYVRKTFLGWREDLEVGDAEFDKKFLLETSTPTKASRALGPEERRDVVNMWGCGVQRLVLENGRLTVTAECGVLEPENYGYILGALDRIAHAFDRTDIDVKVLGGKRRALVDRKGGTRCPYCRTGITGAENDLVACEGCHTVLHEACWAELGRCPILGCRGSQPERAATR